MGAYKIHEAFKTLTQPGRASFKLGANYNVIQVAATLQVSPHIDKVEGVMLVGTYDTTGPKSVGKIVRMLLHKNNQ